MKKKNFILFMAAALVAFFCLESFAETIYFRDGKVLNEEIIEKGSYYIITKTGDDLNKYFTGQIDHIEEDGPEDGIDMKNIDIAQLEKMGMSVEKIRLVMALMESSGVRRNMEQNVEKVIAKAPADEKWRYEELFNIDEIIQLLIPIYNRYYSEEDLREIIRFHESPAGQRIREVTPLIMRDVSQASLEYFKEKISPQ